MKQFPFWLAFIFYSLATCLPSYGESVRPRVFNGVVLDPAGYSVAFLSTPDVSCSGFAVSSRHILTAGHCVTDFQGQPITIQVRGITTTATKSRRFGAYDVGIISAKDRLPGPKYRLRAGLFPKIGETIRVLGFGLPVVGQLTSAELAVTGSSGKKEFTASGGLSAPCQGDSGGPAVYTFHGREYAVGLVSSGFGECSIGQNTTFSAIANPAVFDKIQRIITTPPKKRAPKSGGGTNPFKGCTTGNVADGPLGFVWKPTGSHRDEAVLVLPDQYVLQTASVQLFSAEPARKLIERLTETSDGSCPAGVECLNRPTFTARSSGAAYENKYGAIAIRVTTKAAQCFLYKIRHPGARYD
jgi:hypothetical protein